MVGKLRVAVLLASLSGLQPDDVLDRARRLAESGRVEQAVRLLEARSRQSPRPAELAYLAQLQAAAGGIPQAAASLRRALDLAPEQDGLRVTLGAMLFELRRYEDARRELETVLTRREDHGLARYYLAAVERGLGDLERAERSAARAVELLPPGEPAPIDSLDPSPAAAARHLLAEIRFERGREAEPLLREVLAIEPGHASARYLLSRILSARGLTDQAEAELRLFSRIKRAESRVKQGLDLARAGRTEQAIAELRAALEARPDDPRTLFLLGRELLRSGARKEAASYLSRAASLRPDAKGRVSRLLAEAH